MARHAIFHSAGQQRLALVATEPGVLAGLDLRNGNIVWRQVLPDGETVQEITQYGKGLLSVSNSSTGAYLRLWGPLGGMLWDAHVPIQFVAGTRSPPPSVAVSGSAVVMAWQSDLHAFHGGTGELLWRASAPRAGAQMLSLIDPASMQQGGSIAASTATNAGTSPSPPMHAFAINNGDLEMIVYEPAAKGDRTGLVAGTSKNFGLKPILEGPAVLTLDGAQLVMINKDGTRALVHDVGSHEVHALHIPDLPDGVTAQLEPIRLPRMILLTLSTGGSLLLELPIKTKGSAALIKMRAEEGPAGRHIYACTASKEGKAVIALASLGESHMTASPSLTFQTLTAGLGGVRSTWSDPEALPYNYDEFGPLSRGWLNTYARKDGSFGHRLLLSSSEHSLQLIQTGKEAKVGWLRAEALGSVRLSVPVPLPALMSDADNAAETRPSFAFVLPILYESVKRRLEQAAASPIGPSSADAGPPPTHADAYGFPQAFVSTTSAGKLFALHSSDGSVLWSRRLPAPAADAHAGPPELPFLFVLRGGAHPQAAVIAQGRSAWTLHVLSPTTGKLLDVASPSGVGRVVHAMQLTMLAAADGSTRPPLLIVDDTMAVHLYPDTSEVRSGVSSLLSDLYLYLHAPSTGALTGYGIVKTASGDFKAARRWALALPRDEHGQKVSLASFAPDAAVHSPVRVLGDRSVLHKYVNRNLLAVGVERPGDGEFEEPSLLLMMVDTVSGRVVHSISQQGMRGPLSMLLGENWLVWHFWNPKGLSYQISVVELFTNSTVSDDPLTLMLGGAPDYSLRENGFDAFAHPPPHVLSQSYAFAAPVEALGVTQTIKGITPKFVLVGTTAGQLVLLDKRFLDPRRPLVHGGPQKMSNADKEEGLIPYGPSLGGISPLSVASHRHSIARPRRITAFPTHLESTSIAFMVGLDLFMSRVTPAREFDRLNEDFNYIALIFAIIGLTIGTYVTGILSDRKDLKRAWK